MSEKTKQEESKPFFSTEERAEILKKFNIGNIVCKLGGNDVDCGYEAEIGAEALRRETNGRQTMTNHGGYYIPDFVLDGIRTLGKGSGGAAIVATDLLADEIVTPLEARLILTKLGVRYLDNLVGDVSIPRSSGVTAHWITLEGGNATKVNPTFDQINATPHTCAAYVEITRKLALQSSIRAQAFIGDLILRACANALEVAAISGTGADGQPLGLVGTEGVSEIDGITPGSPTRDNILDFIAAVEDANADTDGMKWLAPSRVKAALKKVIDAQSVTATTGDDVTTAISVGAKHLWENNAIEDYPAIMSNIAPAKKLILGDWREMCICRWGRGIELMSDPYSLSTSGGVRIISFLDADVVVRQPGAFAFGQILA